MNASAESRVGLTPPSSLKTKYLFKCGLHFLHSGSFPGLGQALSTSFCTPMSSLLHATPSCYGQCPFPLSLPLQSHSLPFIETLSHPLLSGLWPHTRGALILTNPLAEAGRAIKRTIVSGQTQPWSVCSLKRPIVLPKQDVIHPSRRHPPRHTHQWRKAWVRHNRKPQTAPKRHISPGNERTHPPPHRCRLPPRHRLNLPFISWIHFRF